MPNRPAPIRQSDLTRYARAMRAAGIENWQIEIRPDGTIVISTGTGNQSEGPNPCDELLVANGVVRK